MKPRFSQLTKTKLLGKSVQMSLVNNRTHDLWKAVAPVLNQEEATFGKPRYSVQVYDDLHYFKQFNPQTTFTKWAAIEAVHLQKIPIGFSQLTLEGGLYAVFHHKGDAKEFQKTAHYIYGEWLPNSGYLLDDRPHFELLGAHYKNNHPDSEEEVWIPIKKKK